MDLISRQDVIDALEISLENDYVDATEFLTFVKQLPSAEPERKKGEWIEYPDCLQYEDAYTDDDIACSNCHHVFNIMDNCTEEFDFCPHCGADMRGE